MTVNDVVQRVNRLLAGEQLVYSYLVEFLDSTIDDINEKLNSCFPTFSDITQGKELVGNIDYSCFPDKYIRSVVVPGAVYKFYIMDEEGISTAEQFGFDYEKGLFMMMRDYIDDVPEEYQATSKGSVVLHEDMTAFPTPFNFEVW